jgi:hypothetical protein
MTKGSILVLRCIFYNPTASIQQYVSESYGGVKKAKPKQQPKDDGKESATEKSSIHYKEVAPDEGDPDLHDSFAIQATAIDDEYLMDTV